MIKELKTFRNGESISATVVIGASERLISLSMSVEYTRPIDVAVGIEYLQFVIVS